MINKNLLIQIKNKNLNFLNENKIQLLNDDLCEHNRTIFMYCLKFNFLDFFEEQIKNLKNPFHNDLSNYTILDYIIKHDVKYFNKFIDKFNYKKIVENKKWPHKFLAISFNNQKVLERLFKLNNDVNIKSNNLFSLINYSIVMKRTKTSIYLLNQNAKFKELDHRGWNSLFFAYFYDAIDVIDCIRNLCSEVEFEKMITQQDIFGKNPKDYKNTVC